MYTIWFHLHGNTEQMESLYLYLPVSVKPEQLHLLAREDLMAVSLPTFKMHVDPTSDLVHQTVAL